MTSSRASAIQPLQGPGSMYCQTTERHSTGDQIAVGALHYDCAMECCKVRTPEDIDRVVDRVRLGEWVSVRIGGIRLPRHGGLGTRDTLCVLEHRLAETGALLYAGSSGTPQTRLFRGRIAVAGPDSDGGDEAGVREPRRTPPKAPSMVRRGFA